MFTTGEKESDFELAQKSTILKKYYEMKGIEEYDYILASSDKFIDEMNKAKLLSLFHESYGQDASIILLEGIESDISFLPVLLRVKDSTFVPLVTKKETNGLLTLSDCAELVLWKECETCDICKETNEDIFIYGKKSIKKCPSYTEKEGISDEKFIRLIYILLGNHASFKISNEHIQKRMSAFKLSQYQQVILEKMNTLSSIYVKFTNTYSRKRVLTNVKAAFKAVKFDQLDDYLQGIINSKQ